MNEQLAAAIAAIDAANAQDPTTVTARGRTGPKEIVHADLVSEWVTRLRPDAGDALLLAARGHHFPALDGPTTYPAGRAGYLRWRRDLHQQHARELGAVLVDASYDPATVDRVQALVRKDGLGKDPEVQVLEDALCLVFLETQLGDVAARLEPDVLDRVIVKTAQKMSDAGIACVADVPLDPVSRRVLDGALARDAVQRYLDALAAHEWAALAATLAPDVHRIGPYGDMYDGRAPYAAFLEQTIAALSGYELVVDRLLVAGPDVTVELSETVDDGDARLHTDEAVVFGTASGLITRVAVYLRTSERKPRT